MIPTTFHGESVYLLPYFANWAEALSLKLEVISDITRSLGGREARRSYAHTLRADFSCSLFLEEGESASFRNGLRDLGDKRILMPLWPFAHNAISGHIVYTDSVGNMLAAPDGAFYHQGSIPAPLPPFMTGIWLTFEPDFSAWEIHESSSATRDALNGSDTAIRVPLMLGILSSLPEPRAVTPGLLTTAIKFRDTGPVQNALVASGAVPPANSDGRFIFPFEPDWGANVTAGGARYEITRADIGHGRAPATTYYPQLAARPFEATFKTFAWSDLASLISFFHSHEGAVKSFWVSHPMDGLILSRFSKPSLEFTFNSGEVSTTKIAFLEVPDELSSPSGEMLGKTMGGLERPAYLYRFTRKYPGLAIVDRFTSFERNVVVGGELYQSRGHWDHGDIKDSLRPEQTKVSITSRAFEGNPLMLFSPPRLESPLLVEILECFPDVTGGAATANSLFVGRIRAPSIKGPVITAEAGHILQDLELDAPTMLIQPGCNYELFSGPCGLRVDDWTFGGALARMLGQTITVSGFSRMNGSALPPIDGGWFAYGRVWLGAGASFENRTIYDSTALANGEITLTISHPFNALTGTVRLVPGCSGEQRTCKAIFNNYNRFGGHPYVPVGNPSLKSIEKDTKQGKK